MTDKKKKKKQFGTSLEKERAKQAEIEKKIKRVKSRPKLTGGTKAFHDFMDKIFGEMTDAKRKKIFGHQFESRYERRGKARHEKKGGVIKKKKGGKV